MDKIERIKRYLDESRREKESQPISIDLSKIIDTNHAKTFATKQELGERLISLTNEYTKRLESIKENVELTDSQIIGNIERLNMVLADNINGLIKKTESDKIELSEKFIKELGEKTNEIGKRIDLVNEPVFTVIAKSENRVSELENIIAKLSSKLNSLVIPKQVTLKGGKNVSVNTKETEKGIEYTINSTSKEITHLYNNTTQIDGVTIGMGVSLTDNLAEGVSNYYYRGDRLVGTGGVSVSTTGLTTTIFSQPPSIFGTTFLLKTTIQSGTSAGYAGITELMFNMGTSEVYQVSSQVIYRSGNTAMGVLFGINSPSGASQYIYSQKTITSTAVAGTDQLSTAYLIANDTPLPNSTAETSSVLDLMWKTGGVVINNGTSGLFQLRVSKENVAGQWDILPGSYMSYTRLR